jgi:translation initiation factor IF-3
MINDRIRFPQVRVVDENNAQLGVMPTREAVGVAQDRGLDLILVAGNAQPPVCRIMNYGKFKYEQSKKKDGAKKAANELKMVRLHPRTGPHDRDIIIRHSERFLREGHKVRVVCQFKGRENAYPELGRAQMDAISKALEEISTVEGQVTKQGRDMTMMLAPKAGVKPLPKVSKADARKAQLEAEEDAKFAAQQKELEVAAEEPTDDLVGTEVGDTEEANEASEAPPEPESTVEATN